MPAKIYITGPESTGKTTLAKALAKSLGAPWVPEYARTYLSRLQRQYRKSDLLEIAKAQANWEDGARATNNSPIVCDTGMLVLKIWSEYKFGDANKWITKRLEQQRPHLHLLRQTTVAVGAGADGDSLTILNNRARGGSSGGATASRQPAPNTSSRAGTELAGRLQIEPLRCG